MVDIAALDSPIYQLVRNPEAHDVPLITSSCWGLAIWMGSELAPNLISIQNGCFPPWPLAWGWYCPHPRCCWFHPLCLLINLTLFASRWSFRCSSSLLLKFSPMVFPHFCLQNIPTLQGFTDVFLRIYPIPSFRPFSLVKSASGS